MIDFPEDKKDEFNVECKHCHKVYSIYLYEEDFDAWNNDEGYIQDLMSYLTAGEREFIKTGITPDDWDSMFGDGGEMYE